MPNPPLTKAEAQRLTAEWVSTRRELIWENVRRVSGENLETLSVLKTRRWSTPGSWLVLEMFHPRPALRSFPWLYVLVWRHAPLYLRVYLSQSVKKRDAPKFSVAVRKPLVYVSKLRQSRRQLRKDLQEKMR